MSAIATGPVMNVVMDEFDVDIRIDATFVFLSDGHRGEMFVAERIRQEAIHHLRRGAIVFLVDADMAAHEFPDFVIVDNAFHPVFTVWFGLVLGRTAARGVAVTILFPLPD